MRACSLPDRGPFAFPAPYTTTGIRLTNASDMGGADALWPTGMAYWQAINAHEPDAFLRAFVGIDRKRGGAGPSLYVVDKGTLEVIPAGPLFPPEHALSWQTGEGWYWSATDPLMLYCADDEHLYRLNVDTHELTTVVDLTPFRFMGKHALRQWHTSHDGQVHSCTVLDASNPDIAWPKIGNLVYRERECHPWAGAWIPKAGVGVLDEAQVDQGGAWLLIKQDLDGVDGEDNRIRDLLGVAPERTLMDRDGAAGHSDNGWGYMVAADNWYPAPATWRLWPFDANAEPQGLVVDSRPWERQVKHVSHGNAQPGAPDAQWVLGSTDAELVRIPLDGSLICPALCPTLVDLTAPGGGVDTYPGEYDYAKLPKANLDPYGQFALWTSNHGSDRLDAFVVKLG